MTRPDSDDGANAPSPDVRSAGPSTPENGRRDIWNQLDQSSIMSVELIAAILVWGGVGLALDRWLHTDPWFMGAGVLIGFGAGLYLIWMRSSTEQQHPSGFTGADQGARRDEETDTR
jgi:F0F1-type ATP synthase assembly protein I